MKTPEEIKKGLECCIKDCNWENGCLYGAFDKCTTAMMEDALALIRQLEAKLAEYEKPLVPMTFEDVIEKSKRIDDNAIWLEQPDEEYGYDDTDCIPALVSNFANYRTEIQYLLFLVWPKREIIFPVAEKGCYGKTWRCWPRKPTDEERKAVKWDE